MGKVRRRIAAVALFAVGGWVAFGSGSAAPAPTATTATPAAADAASLGSDATAGTEATAAASSRAVPRAASPHVTAASVLAGLPKAPHGEKWKVGVAKALLDPSAADVASHQLHLGGYGILPTRATTGRMQDIYVSAMAISDGSGHTLLLAALENQGTFSSDKQGPYGISDIRAAVSAKTGVPADMIVVNSDHSHAGPDLIGLWGGVPVDYLKYVHDQAVTALEAAFASEVPADLLVGVDTPVLHTPQQDGYVVGSATPGEDMVHSQFAPDTQTGYDDSAVDTQLRVLQAVDEHGKPIGTLINYAAHATVMGGGNTLYSADWPGQVARATESALGEGVAVTMVADVGRSQPPRPNSDAKCDTPGHPSCDLDKLDTYTRLLTPFVVDAVGTATPVTGHGVSGEETLIRESATNPALLGVSYTGELPIRGYGAYRSAIPPYVTGTVIGSFVSVHRIGDVLLTAAPGEAYPDIRFGVNREVSGMQATFTFGLANDQLGYLIAPTTEYGWITTSNVGNDNSFFNVAPQFGDHVMCTQVALAERIGFRATGDPAPYGSKAPAPPCALITATDLLPLGPTPQQPWPFGDGIALPPPFPQ